MNKKEILEWIKARYIEAEREEWADYHTELASRVYQKIYDFLEYNLED